jgi:hypothetical protein
LNTTSLSVQGAYKNATSEESPLCIDFGHSKEQRPDLKQIMFGLDIVEGIPLFAEVMAGHTSDVKWNGNDRFAYEGFAFGGTMGIHGDDCRFCDGHGRESRRENSSTIPRPLLPSG